MTIAHTQPDTSSIWGLWIARYPTHTTKVATALRIRRFPKYGHVHRQGQILSLIKEARSATHASRSTASAPSSRPSSPIVIKLNGVLVTPLGHINAPITTNTSARNRNMSGRQGQTRFTEPSFLATTGQRCCDPIVQALFPTRPIRGAAAMVRKCDHAKLLAADVIDNAEGKLPEREASSPVSP